MGHRCANLFYLGAKQVPKAKKRTSIKERSKPVEEEKLADRDSGHSCQRRGYRAHARNKFRHHHAAQAVPREHILRSADTRVRLKRDATKKAQNLVASMPAQVEPKSI